MVHHNINEEYVEIFFFLTKKKIFPFITTRNTVFGRSYPLRSKICGSFRLRQLGRGWHHRYRHLVSFPFRFNFDFVISLMRLYCCFCLLYSLLSFFMSWLNSELSFDSIHLNETQWYTTNFRKEIVPTISSDVVFTVLRINRAGCNRTKDCIQD